MLNLLRKPDQSRPVNPRFRAYGKARIDIAQRAATRDDWDRLWKKSTFSFPFSWGGSWKQCIEYKVADFPAEVGFFIDILGFPVNAFDPDYAMFTSPAGEFYFSVVPALEGEPPTPPDAIRLQFMVESIMVTARELEHRGVVFEQLPEQSGDGSSLLIASFRSPHGIGIDLWGLADKEYELEAGKQLASGDPQVGDHLEAQPSGNNLDSNPLTSQENSESQIEDNRATENADNQGELIDIEYFPEE